MPKKGKQIEVKCETCNKPKTIPEWKYRNNKYKRFYCCVPCKLKGTERKVETKCALESCGKEISIHKSQFERTDNNYCCVEHKIEAQNNKIELKCDFCDKKIEINPFQLKWERHFCNADCCAKFFDKREIIECVQCGSDIKRSSSLVKVSDSHFCDQKCYGKWRSENLTGENNARFVEKIKDNCPNCNKIVERYPCHTLTYNNKFCNPECVYEYYKTYYLGENNPNWRGGLSFDDYSPEFNEALKEQVRERDGRKCKICEKTEENNGVSLSCHHIDYIKTNCCKSNLISLCGSCHPKTNTNREY